MQFWSSGGGAGLFFLFGTGLFRFPIRSDLCRLCTWRHCHVFIFILLQHMKLIIIIMASDILFNPDFLLVCYAGDLLCHISQDVGIFRLKYLSKLCSVHPKTSRFLFSGHPQMRFFCYVSLYLIKLCSWPLIMTLVTFIKNNCKKQNCIFQMEYFLMIPYRIRKDDIRYFCINDTKI